MKKRTAEVNVDKIEEFIENEVKDNNNLLQTYTAMKLIAEKFEKAPRGHYEYSNYQAYVAARLASRPEPTQALKLGAG